MRSTLFTTLLTFSLASAAVHKRQDPSTSAPADTAAPTSMDTTMMPTSTDMDTAMPTATDDANADADAVSWDDNFVVVQDPDCTTETGAAGAAAPTGSWAGSNWTDSPAPGSAPVAPAAGDQDSGSGWQDAGEAKPVAPYMGGAAETRALGIAAIVGLGSLMVVFA